MRTRSGGPFAAAVATPQARRMVLENGGRPVLVTIPLSHYCEKARWALEHAQVAFSESPHAPGMHASVVRRLGGRHATPLLVTGEGAIHPSAEIVKWANAAAPLKRQLYPTGPNIRAEAAALERLFDDELGPHARRLAYFDLLPYASLVVPLMTHGVPALERVVCRSTYSILRALMRRGMGIDDAGVAASNVAVAAVFREVERRLADGRPYLLGERFSGTDITFAALAAPLVFPPEYAVPLPALEALPRQAADRIRAARDACGGEFCLRLFREHRR